MVDELVAVNISEAVRVLVVVAKTVAVFDAVERIVTVEDTEMVTVLVWVA